jgi:hypothetical protein
MHATTAIALMVAVDATGLAQPPCTDSTAILIFHCLRQPPVFHLGERIQARLLLRSIRGYTYLPEGRRWFFLPNMVAVEPGGGSLDPITLDNRIRIGGSGGWSEAKSVEQPFDVNEWAQIHQPGLYRLRLVLKHDELQKGPVPLGFCQLQSNREMVQILPADTRWEAIQLARGSTLLESGSLNDRLQGAAVLRYLNTVPAAEALVKWYMRAPGEPADSDLAKGLFESSHADVVMAGLEKAIRSNPRLADRLSPILQLLRRRRGAGGLG